MPKAKKLSDVHPFKKYRNSIFCGFTVGRGRCNLTHDHELHGYNEKLHELLTTDHIGNANRPVMNITLGGSSGVTLTAYEGGATRTPKAERRELIPKTAVDALARRLALGAAKHGVNNWRKGGPEFRLATVNHLLDHIFEYLENGGSENTDAIICNAAFLCEYEAREPYVGVPKK